MNLETIINSYADWKYRQEKLPPAASPRSHRCRGQGSSSMLI